MAKEPSYAWEPQIGPQLDAIILRECPELFYGGSRGAGKSFYLLGDFLQDVQEFGEVWQGIIFRRTYNELEQLIRDSHRIYPKTGAEWKAGDKFWRWPNGATLYMRFIDTLADCERYQGHAYPWLAWDELTNWPTDESYNKMRACNRWASEGIIPGNIYPYKRIRATGNPGGAGHIWVKSYFVDPAPMGGVPIYHEKSGRMRMYIRAKVTDNRILMHNDPDYIDDLRAVGSDELVKAWLEGDWNVVMGAFFSEFSDVHVIEPFTIPDEWLRFTSHDWGSSAPFVHQWWAVSDGSLELPPGAIVMYRELYGAEKPGVGLKRSAEEVARMILELQNKDEKITYGVADRRIFDAEGGPSIAERMRRVGLVLRAGDPSRVPGANQVRARLKGEERPMIFFFKTCPHSIRTLASVQHDDKNPEDVKAQGDDHAYDAIKLACMSRPYARPVAEKKQDPTKWNVSLDMLWKDNERKNTIQRRVSL